MLKVLGVDLASGSWRSNGTAVITFDPSSRRFETVETNVIPWPSELLTATSLSEAIDTYARENDICAIALDGPQGWRDPATPAGARGVGRRCEYECATQGKTGVYPITFPSNQRPWIEFCIELFAELLNKPDVQLAAPAAARRPPEMGYFIVECFPTSAWRSSGLTPLPRKAKRPDLIRPLEALRNAYGLPSVDVTSHDDLQALIASIVAAAVVGGPAKAVAAGEQSALVTHEDGLARRVEGLIWNCCPLEGAPQAPPSEPASTARPTRQPEVRVTQPVLDQIARTSARQSQIAVRNLPGGTRSTARKIEVILRSERYCLIIGDTHAAWRSHQDATTLESFDRLFALLADRPDVWHAVSVWGGVDSTDEEP